MEPLEETKHYERVRRSATQLTQFTTIDWVVDGRRERVKIMRHQEQAKRLAEHMHEHSTHAWQDLFSIASRLPFGMYITAAMRVIGTAAEHVARHMHEPLVTAAETLVVVLVGTYAGRATQAETNVQAR